MKNLSHLIFISLIAAVTIIFCACGQPNGPIWETTDRSLLITVEGFSCTACTNGFGSCMSYNDGIDMVHTDLTKIDDNVLVEYDPKKISPKQIIEMVEPCGFTAKELK